MRKKHNRKKRMIFGSILYLIILLIVLFPARYTNSIYGYLPFLFMVFLLLFSTVQLLALRRKIRLVKEFSDIECTRGEEVGLKITVLNKSILMCQKASVIFFVSDLFGGEDTQTVIDFTVSPKSSTDFPFSLKMDHIGDYTGGIKDLVIYDMLGIFSCSGGGEGKFDIHVLPRIEEYEAVDLSEEVSIESIRDSKVSQYDGSDYTGVREYAFGDSMKHIHWKLSAHSAGYMTKITEIIKERELAVIVDVASPSYTKEELMQIYDTIVESSLSFATAKGRREMNTSVVYLSKENEIRKMIPQDDSGFKEFISRLSVIHPDPDVDFADGAFLLDSEEKMQGISTDIAVFTSRITQELVQGLIKIRRQNRTPVLFVILPSGMSQRERENYIAPLRSLDDYAISYQTILPKL